MLLSNTTGFFNKAASEIVPFFDSIISFAQGRENNKIFMSGSAYDKFCETVLILTQKVRIL